MSFEKGFRCMLPVFLIVCAPQVMGRDICPGTINVAGEGGLMTLVNAQWNTPGDKAGFVEVKDRMVIPHMKGRTYFADTCTSGKYDNNDYAALKLLGKTIRYTVDLSGAGCGCNAALYLTSLKQNPKPSGCSDHYCDANNVCGESCAEIDIQEANTAAWHSTLHTMTDHNGVGGGYGGGSGWNGPRDWSSSQYGPDASCINTKLPIKVAVSFPIDGQGTLTAMQITLAQDGHSCTLSLNLGSYSGMGELSGALAAGMTPIISYWSGDMMWMDGKGQDQQGPCAQDNPGVCEDTVKFYGFSIANVGDPEPEPTIENDADISFGSNEASTESNVDVQPAFCCFVGTCGRCEAMAESNSVCGESKSQCESCTGHANWCPKRNLAFVMKEARFNPSVESRINIPNHHSLVGKVALSTVTFITITMTLTAVVFGFRRWQHTRLYGHLPVRGDATTVVTLAPNKGDMA